MSWNLAKFHTEKDLRRHTMYKSMEITRERVATFDTDIFMIMAAFVGVWGVACLIGGLASTDGFHEIGRNLTTAFTGM
jgi:hypothetical protein